RALADGTLLRGEVLVRWRQFVDEGGLRAALRGQGGFGQRIRATFGRPEPGSGRLLAALGAALVTLVVETLADADDRVRTAWSADPAGAGLLTGGAHTLAPGRVAVGAVRTDQVRALLRDWLAGVREAAGEEPVALLAVLRILAGELPLEPREEARVRGVLGQPAVGTLVETHQADLLARIGAVLDADAAAFTALARMELSTVGVRRPTTAHAFACVWGPDGAVPLLDWLEVAPERRFSRESVLDGDAELGLRGLVLLDLPDFDSLATEHRAEV